MSRTRKNIARNVRDANRIEADVNDRNWDPRHGARMLRFAKKVRYGHVGSDCSEPDNSAKNGRGIDSVADKAWAKNQTARILRRQGKREIAAQMEI